MAKCKKCDAELVDGTQFCEACGEPVVEKKSKRKIKGVFGGKNKKNETVSEAATSALNVAETPDAVDLADEPLPSTDDMASIEQEAQDWANNTTEDLSDDIHADLPTANSDYAPDKRLVPSAVFIARNKNGIGDKFVGLLLFAVIFAIIVMSFVLNTGLADANEILISVNAYVPLLILMLGALVIARTGSLDLGIPVVTVVTYLLLSDSFTNQNIYPMMIACLGAAIGLGLILGALTVVGKVPTVFSSVIVLIVGITYISVMFTNDLSAVIVPYVETTAKVVPIILIAIAVIASFVLIYMTKLGKPLFKRKGLTGKSKLLYVLAFAFAYLLAAGAGIAASIYGALPLTLDGSIFGLLDLVLGLLFILALSGASTLFDNRSMPVLVALLSFIAWFGIIYVLAHSGTAMAEPQVAIAIKIGFVALALIADRVYTKAHFADFYQTINVKK